MAKLTTLQRRTCEIYHSMKKPNKTQAYKLAGSKSKGRTLEQEAYKTLKRPLCREYLKKLRKKSEEHAVKTADDIIKELEKLAFSNIKNYITVEGNSVKIKNFEDLTEAQLAAIAEISKTTGGTVKIRLYDKRGSLKDLGLRFGIFPTKVELTGNLTLAQAVHEAMKDKKK